MIWILGGIIILLVILGLVFLKSLDKFGGN